MKTAVAAMGLLAFAAVVPAAWAEAPAPGSEMPEGVELRKELRAGQERLAVWVDVALGGKSRLMLERSKTANPPGRPVRGVHWGDNPFAQACPVSREFTAKVGALGEGTVMGSLALLETYKAGVYLLFRPMKGAERLLLVSVIVDNTGKVAYATHAEAKRVNEPFSTEGDLPIADVNFRGMDLDLRMRWGAQTWYFTLQPALMYV